MNDTCPNCGESYKMLGSHWKSCGFPKLSHKQRRVITGLVMGDAYINRREGRNPRLQMETANPTYLSYLDELFGCFSSRPPKMSRSAEEMSNRDTIKRFEGSEYQDLYAWGTRSLPELKEWSNWYGSDGKVWPEDIFLAPETLKHWYVGDGSFHKENKLITIYLSKEGNNKKKVENYFKEVDLPEPIWETYERMDGSKSIRIRWNLSGSKKLLNYMGEPPEGFDYKWP